jgi:hypothetical protein
MRSGAGLFYDSGLASALNPVNGSPFDRWQFQTTGGASNTFTPHQSGSTSIPTAPAIHLPRVLEWRTALEQRIRESALLSLAYIGSSGQSLLRQEAYLSPNANLLAALQLTSRGYANYHALQMQFNGDLAPGLQGMASYTWAHSIDNGSQSSSVFLVEARTALERPRIVQLRCTPDRIHRLDLSPASPTSQSLSSPVLSSWILSTTRRQARISRRNALYGSPIFQADLSVRRRFHLHGPISLEATISSFNVLNNPAFANPVQYLLSPWFGRATSMANLMLGAGSPSSGLTPLFQSGGPRTFETGLRLTF